MLLLPVILPMLGALPSSRSFSGVGVDQFVELFPILVRQG